jgi:hypothetical protein
VPSLPGLGESGCIKDSEYCLPLCVDSTVVDLCTRFIWLYAIADKASDSITACLRELCAIFGKPLRIQTDNGTEFKNLNMTTLLSKMGTEHRFSSPYYPQGNGAAERAVRSVEEHLNAACRGDTSSWPKNLPAVQYGCNTTVHRRHGSAPFSNFFARGHNPWRSEPMPPSSGTLSRKQLLARNRHMHEVVFPTVTGRTRSYADGVFETFAKRHNIIKEDYPPGALVMRQQLPRGSKLLPAWEGPYMVVQRSRGGAYLLRDTTNDLLASEVPASQLRLVFYEGGISPDSFEVDHIVRHIGEGDILTYLIRWKGFDPEHDSWVQHKDVNTLACIAEYWDKRRQTLAPRGSLTEPRARREGPPAQGQGAQAAEQACPQVMSPAWVFSLRKAWPAVLTMCPSSHRYASST